MHQHRPSAHLTPQPRLKVPPLPTIWTTLTFANKALSPHTHLVGEVQAAADTWHTGCDPPTSATSAESLIFSLIPLFPSPSSWEHTELRPRGWKLKPHTHSSFTGSSSFTGTLTPGLTPAASTEPTDMHTGLTSDWHLVLATHTQTQSELRKGLIRHKKIEHTTEIRHRAWSGNVLTCTILQVISLLPL